MSAIKQILSVGILLVILLASCTNKKDVPTEEEKAQAVKDVLKQGVDKAVTILSNENGFLTDDSLKISLPPEAQSLIDNIKKLPQGKELLNKAMSQINQIAGSSVELIAPVMYAAIDSMSVEDVNRILLSDSAAATAYLEKKTRIPLQRTCEPLIQQSMDKKLWGDVTTEDTWSILIENYNKLAGSGFGKIANMDQVDLELDEFITEKVLDAIFYLIAKEEMNVRKHPAARISKSIAKSFGWADEH